MSKLSAFQGVRLPRDWPEYVKSAVIQSIALAHRAITYTRSFAINSSIERVRLAGELDRVQNENAFGGYLLRAKTRFTLCIGVQNYGRCLPLSLNIRPRNASDETF